MSTEGSMTRKKFLPAGFDYQSNEELQWRLIHLGKDFQDEQMQPPG